MCHVHVISSRDVYLLFFIVCVRLCASRAIRAVNAPLLAFVVTCATPIYCHSLFYLSPCLWECIIVGALGWGGCVFCSVWLQQRVVANRTSVNKLSADCIYLIHMLGTHTAVCCCCSVWKENHSALADWGRETTAKSAWTRRLLTKETLSYHTESSYLLEPSHLGIIRTVRVRLSNFNQKYKIMDNFRFCWNL